MVAVSSHFTLYTLLRLQVRRLISWAAEKDGSGCTFTIDSPFATTLDPSSGEQKRKKPPDKTIN